MKDRREESMLSNYLSGLWEILGRDKVTSFLSDHESGQNSRTAVRRLRLRVVEEPLGTMALHCKTPPLARRRGAIGDNFRLTLSSSGIPQ